MTRNRIFLVATSVVMLTMLGAVATAWACSQQGSLHLSPPSAAPGTSVDATGRVWEVGPNPVGLYLVERGSRALGEAIARADVRPDGRFTATFTVPEAAAAGAYYIVAQQRRLNGSTISTQVQFQVQAVTAPARSRVQPQARTAPASVPADRTAAAADAATVVREPSASRVTGVSAAAAGTAVQQPVRQAAAQPQVAPARQPATAPLPAGATARNGLLAMLLTPSLAALGLVAMVIAGARLTTSMRRRAAASVTPAV